MHVCSQIEKVDLGIFSKLLGINKDKVRLIEILQRFLLADPRYYNQTFGINVLTRCRQELETRHISLILLIVNLLYTYSYFFFSS